MDVITTFQLSSCSSRTPTPTGSANVTPTSPPEPLVTTIGECLLSGYQLNELPPADGGKAGSCSDTGSAEVVVNTAYLLQLNHWRGKIV